MHQCVAASGQRRQAVKTDKPYLVYLLFNLAWIFWRWATPFWRFRDVNRGTREQRIANYRHNRALREILPGYTLKWMAIAAVMLLLLYLSDQLSQGIAGTAAYYCATVFCVSSGIGFSFACVVIAVLMASYFFLTHIRD